MRKPPTREPVAVTIDGRRYAGSYYIERGMVTVETFDYGRKTTQVGGSPPATIAQKLLRELVSERKT